MGVDAGDKGAPDRGPDRGHSGGCNEALMGPGAGPLVGLGKGSARALGRARHLSNKGSSVSMSVRNERSSSSSASVLNTMKSYTCVCGREGDKRRGREGGGGGLRCEESQKVARCQCTFFGGWPPASRSASAVKSSLRRHT